MGVLSWLSKPTKPDYETLLARLSTNINEAKTHLSEIRLRERRISLLLNLYGVGIWVLWVGLWYVRGLPLGLIGLGHDSLEGKIVGVGGIALGPIFIYLLNQIVHFYFRRQRTREETHLRVLLSQQRKHLEEIKKATNYDSTRKLIERYDDPSGITSSPSPSTPQRRMPDSPSPAPKGQPQVQGQGQRQVQNGPGGTPRAPGHLTGAGGTPGLGSGSPATPMHLAEGLSPDQQAAMMQMQMHAIQPVLPPPEKKWYDRVVDSILGDDPSQAAQSKYALVCGECFRHNGLVGSQYEWERMQWICPRCNHLNPPPISRSSSHSQIDQAPTTPLSRQPQSSASATASHIQRSSAGTGSNSPRRRAGVGAGEKGTPRSSRLGKEVFSADESEGMEVDDEE